jgi:NAD(P)H-dependent FMN reductase
MHLLAFAASVRTGSYNRALITLAARHATELGATVDLANFREFDMPLYDADLEARRGVPTGGLELAMRIARNRGLMIATPEYNFSMPGTLKNAIDWVSRVRPLPFTGRSCLLLSASRSRVGGQRGLLATRVPLESLGVFVYPESFSVAQAPEAFAADGSLRDPALGERLRRVVAAYLRAASAWASVDAEEPARASRSQ